ncbi:unnamed protein product [Lymnaea stagnalis]|uniref:CUB domain-containing protein n=1 Tax=Lymnaea stagnalis TaxID=6523 RepID=A0AAV2GZY6_LYMST
MWLPILVMCAGLTYVAGIARNITIDLSGPGCDNILDYQLKGKDDLATVYSVRQRNAAGSRDHCDVTVSTVKGSRIQYLIEVIQFDECGQEIYIYDDRTFDSALLHRLRCTDNNNVPLFGKSKDDVIRIRVRKPMPEQNLFEFRMRLKNDLGPDFEYQKAQPLHNTGERICFTPAADLFTITLFLTLLFLK